MLLIVLFTVKAIHSNYRQWTPYKWIVCFLLCLYASCCCLRPHVELLFLNARVWNGHDVLFHSRFVAGFLMLGAAGLLTYLERRKKAAEKDD